MNLGFFIKSNLVRGGGMVAVESHINLLLSSHVFTEQNKIVIFIEKLVKNGEFLKSNKNVSFVEVGRLCKDDCLLAKLAEESIHIFITHCHYYLPVFKYFPKIKALGIKIILQQHASPWCPIFEKRIDLWKEQECFLKFCDLITVIDKTSQLYWTLRGFNVVYLPNCVEHKRNVATKEKLVIMAGRFEYFKKFEEGIVAFSIAHSSCPDWKLVIIGQGPCLKSIKQTIKLSGCAKDIKLLPWGDVSNLFAKASIHLMPSHIESFGLVVCDAKNSEIPTVMYDLPSNFLVTHGVDGYRAKVGDVWELSKYLLDLMMDVNLRTQMGINAANSMNENSPDEVLKIWYAIFNFLQKKDICNIQLHKNFYIDQSVDNFKLLLENLKVTLDQLQGSSKKLVKIESFKQNLTKLFSELLVHHRYNILLVKSLFNSLVDRLLKTFKQIYLKIQTKFFIYVHNHFEQNVIIFWDNLGFSKFRECLCLSDISKLSNYTVKVFDVYNNNLSFRKLYWLAKAKVFVTNTNTVIAKKLLTLKKRPIIINAWHDYGYLKRFCSDANEVGIMKFRARFGRPDYVCCSSENIIDEYAKAFGVSSKAILPIGCISADLLLNKNLVEQRKKIFFKKHPKTLHKKIYLYIPKNVSTLYSESNLNNHSFSLNFSLLSSVLKKDEILLIREPQINKSSELFYNFDNKANILIVNDIDFLMCLSVCDVFITDFSTAIFEAVLLNKPIMIFTDEVCLKQAMTDFYLPFETYILNYIYTGTDVNEFISLVRKTLYDGANSLNFIKFKNKFLYNCDGRSTQRLLDFIAKLN